MIMDLWNMQSVPEAQAPEISVTMLPKKISVLKKEGK